MFILYIYIRMTTTPITYNLFDNEYSNNFYSNNDNTINLKFESKSEHFVKFNWGHGDTQKANCMNKLVNDIWTPYLPIQTRTKIYDEDEDTFKIDLYCRKANMDNNDIYPEGSVEHYTIIFHKKNYCVASSY